MCIHWWSVSLVCGLTEEWGENTLKMMGLFDAGLWRTWVCHLGFFWSQMWPYLDKRVEIGWSEGLIWRGLLFFLIILHTIKVLFATIFREAFEQGDWASFPPNYLNPNHDFCLFSTILKNPTAVRRNYESQITLWSFAHLLDRVKTCGHRARGYFNFFYTVCSFNTRL